MISFRNLPNLISFARLVLVPLIIIFVISQDWINALIVFALAGVSDALDGWLAKHFNLESELGSYLDPIADKALLVSLYISLALMGKIPVVLSILVVLRDVLIIAAVILSFALHRKLVIRPLFLSKLNTLAQILLIAVVLAMSAGYYESVAAMRLLFWIIGMLTIASGLAYLDQWVRQMRSQSRAR